MAPIAVLGRFFLEFVQDLGGMFILVGRLLQAIPRTFANTRNILQQMDRIGIGSIPLVLVTSLFVGAVTSVQAAYQFHGYVPLMYIGTVVGKSVILELGPVLTALVVGGRVSASIAAELGTMKVTEQIDAMEMIAIDPVEYLVLPRTVAATIMLPVLTVFSDLLAILGAMVVANISIHVSFNTFESGLKLLFRNQDLIGGLMKTFVFGFIIAIMGCYHGFETRGGAEGVGLATMKAVVSSCLLILISNYFLASLIFRIIFAPSS
ncbi:MAG: ABC transporter permease [Candidatus Krumholzibacteria bacterium]|nr:ABC transporter permease [Candidatus Krumholzibacteria bacterium]